MEREDLIPANDFCTYHSVSYTFINCLHDAGLIQVDVIEDQQYLHLDEIRELEKLAHMHTDLDINIAGIEAIAHLLQRLRQMQSDMRTLQQKLFIYETDNH